MIDVREIISEVTGVPTAELEESSAPGQVPGWDSFATIEILALVEERAGIQLELEEIVELATVADWERCVHERLANGR